MRSFLLFTYVLLSHAFAANASGAALISNVRQRDGGTFKNPASRDRPRFRYWLPDASIDAGVLKENIKSAGDIGAGGVEFLPFYNYGGELSPPPSDVSWAKYGFGSPSFIELFEAALEAHDENSLAMDFAFGPNQGQGVPAWPENDGLQWDLVPFAAPVAANNHYNSTIPGWKSGELVAAVTALVQSSKNITVDTGSDSPFLGDPSYTYEQIILKDGTLNDVTNQVDLSTGQLSVKLRRPCSPGRYRLFAFYQRKTEAKNLQFDSNATAATIWDHGSYTVDHFSSRGARVITDFWDQLILSNGGKERLTKVGNFGWEDSLELNSNISWSPTLPARFSKMFDYDLRPFLPLIMFGNNNVNIQSNAPGSIHAILDKQDRNQGYLNDYRAALSDGYREYLGALRAWVNGTLDLKLSVQPSYNMPMDMLALVPFVDAPESESLQGHDSVDAYRHFAGPSDLVGNKIISNELGAVFGRAFSFAIPELLFSAKRGFSGGINQFVIHGQSYSGDYAETTWPGNVPFSYYVSDLYSNKRPDWHLGLGQTLDYMGRVQTMQRQGHARTDVLVYNKQSITDPNFPTIYPWSDLVNGGWSYNYLSPDNFKLDEAVVEDGVFSPTGPSYKALVLLGSQNLTIDAVESLQAYAKAGLPIIVAGGRPGYYPTSQRPDKNAVERGISDLLRLGNVHSVPSGGVARKLSGLGLKPNVGVRTNGTWYTTWREDAATGVDSLYVFSDLVGMSGELVVQSTKTPYVFDAWTGEQYALLHYRVEDGATIIPLSLAGNQTAIFAFSDQPLDGIPTPDIHATSLPGNVIGYGHDQGGPYLQVAKAPSPGKAKLSTGDNLVLSNNASASIDLKPWTLLAEHWEAPEDMSHASVIAVKRNTTHALDTLVPWNDIPELVNASGVGYYVTTFDWPPGSGKSADGAYVQFPPALNAILLEVNDQRVPPLDPTDPVADISPFLVKGHNKLVAIVPSTMWNYIRSIIGDLENGGSPPLLTTLGIMPPPTMNGLVGTVRVVPFKKVYLE